MVIPPDTVTRENSVGAAAAVAARLPLVDEMVVAVVDTGEEGGRYAFLES